MEAPRGSNPTLLHSFYGFTALGGIVIFLFLERCHNLFCGHGHGHGHSHGLGLDLSKSKVSWLGGLVGRGVKLDS